MSNCILSSMKKSPAYSLIFAFVIMVVIMIIATSTIQNVQGKITYFANLESASQARLAAESAAEQAIMAIKDRDAGYEPNITRIYPDESSTDTYADYEVRSRAETNDNGGAEFYTPIPNSGDAAPTDECSVLSSDKPVDHACNWNRLMYGQSITVPLYADDEFLGMQNLTDLGLTSWALKVRTPCKPDADGNPIYSEDCDGGDRYELNGVNTDYENDASLILWQLIGYDAGGGTVLTEIPNDEPATRGSSTTRDPDLNTEIYESLINSVNSGDFIVLKADLSSLESKYIDIYTLCTNASIEKLILQLEVVSTLEDMNYDSVPYLEWQLVINSNDPPADEKAIIIGEGYKESNTGIFKYPFVITRSIINQRTSSYTVSN